MEVSNTRTNGSTLYLPGHAHAREMSKQSCCSVDMKLLLPGSFSVFPPCLLFPFVKSGVCMSKPAEKPAWGTSAWHVLLPCVRCPHTFGAAVFMAKGAWRCSYTGMHLVRHRSIRVLRSLLNNINVLHFTNGSPSLATTHGQSITPEGGTHHQRKPRVRQ